LPLVLPLVALVAGILFPLPVLRLAPGLAFLIALAAGLALFARTRRLALALAALLAVLLAGALVSTRPLFASAPATGEEDSPLARYIDGRFSYPLAQFARAVILDEDEAIDRIDVDLYRRSGLTHLLAISGFNIGILAAVTWALARLALRRRSVAEYATVAVLVVYTIGIGAPASVLRATLMATLFLLARTLGRPSTPLHLLTATAFLILLFDPAALGNIGFQLSYAATFGIIAWTGPLTRFLPARPRLFWETLAGTVAAQAATLPLMLWHFHEISLIAFLANPVLVPIFSLLYLLVLAGLAQLPGAAPLAELCFALFRRLLERFALMPGAAFAVAAPRAGLVAAMLGILLLPLVADRRRRWACAGALLLVALAFCRPVAPRPGVYLVAARHGGTGLAVIAGDTAVIVDDGLSGARWRRALARLGCRRIERVIAPGTGALAPTGARVLAGLYPIDTWETDSATLVNEESRAGLAVLAARRVPVHAGPRGAFVLLHRGRALSLNGSETAADFCVERYRDQIAVVNDGASRREIRLE